MLKYKIRTTRGSHPLVLVDFEDEKYALAGELLLAERAFLRDIIGTLDKALAVSGAEAGSFSGNAFTMFVSGGTTKITNDINGEETEVPTKDFRKLAKGYKKHYDRIQR